MRRFVLSSVCFAAVVGLAGCGNSSSSGAKGTVDAGRAGDVENGGDAAVQTAEAGRTAAPGGEMRGIGPGGLDLAAPALATETPEQLLAEVVRLSSSVRAEGEPGVITPVAAVSGGDRTKHREIAQLSLEVISQTHSDPAQEQLFNNAVHYLSDAQLRLALEGDADAERELIENAASLLARDPTSIAAIEANAKVVELARGRAEQAGTDEFATAYSNQSRLFATSFPTEVNRAAVTLLDAARWCDRRGFVEQAIACYTELQTSFASTLFASQAEGPIRRLNMLGQPLLEFTGPTIDGGVLHRGQYNGQPMVVAFWDSHDPDVMGTFSALEAARRARADTDIVLIGVCLDEDADAARAAIAALPRCPQVYSSDPSEQGRNNPLAQYYGVQDTPTLWLIDSRGVVVSLDALPSDIATLR